MEFIGNEENRAIWSKHFIQVKSKINQPKRSHKVKVATRKGSSYTYSYADLADVDKAVMEACRQVTDKDGNAQFGYFFDIDNSPDGVCVQTVMVDTSGASMITDKVWFKNTNSGDAQQTAGLISYAKRYSLSAAFGIASEEDDDAQNLKPAVQKPQVRILDQHELDNFEVRVYGKRHLLKDIWNDYLEDHDADTIQWLIHQKDPQTKQAIKQLLDQYKLEQSIEQIKTNNPEPEVKPVKAERAPKPELKVNEQDTDEIKQLVDNDPQPNSVTADKNEQNLFDVF